MASHGTDQLIVQRLLTCRDLDSSQKALVGSGVVVMIQFAVFLLVGLGLWAYYGGQEFSRGDEIFARFVVNVLPAGIRDYSSPECSAAAMSSLSSSINSLASATAYDFWAPLVGAEDDEARILRAGKLFTLAWAALLIGGAVLFIPLSEGTTAVEGGAGRRVHGLRRPPRSVRSGGSVEPRRPAERHPGDDRRDRRGHVHLALRSHRRGMALVRPHRHGGDGSGGLDAGGGRPADASSADARSADARFADARPADSPSADSPTPEAV